jgi:hypothetical protein
MASDNQTCSSRSGEHDHSHEEVRGVTEINMYYESIIFEPRIGVAKDLSFRRGAGELV